VTQSLEKEIGSLRSLFWSERDPEGRAFAPLAEAYGRAGDFKQAVELLTEGIGRHPGFSTGHVVAARLYLDTGLIAEAELAVDSALELDGDNVVALASLAQVREVQGEFEEAEWVRARIRSLELATEEAADVEEDPGVVSADLSPDVTELAPNEAALAQLPDPPLDSATEPVEISPAEVERPVEEDSPGSWLDAAFPDPAQPVEDEPDLEPHPFAADLLEVVQAEPTEAGLSVESDESVAHALDAAPDEPVADVLDLAPDEPVADVLDLAPGAGRARDGGSRRRAGRARGEHLRPRTG
jgi:tetratricopeptide (TPR) repeat protein